MSICMTNWSPSRLDEFVKGWTSLRFHKVSGARRSGCGPRVVDTWRQGETLRLAPSGFGWTNLVHGPAGRNRIVQRFGKVMRTAGPGLHFKLPLGVETVRWCPRPACSKRSSASGRLSTVPGEKTRYDPSGSIRASR
jgi:hypothetical protein